MLAFEERWAVAVLAEFAPAGGPGFSPREGEVDYLGALRGMMRASTRTAALGLRLALWITALAPLWLLGKVQTFRGIARERRTEILQRLLNHRFYIVREMVLVLKMSACFALFRVGSLRERSRYESPKRLPMLGDRP